MGRYNRCLVNQSSNVEPYGFTLIELLVTITIVGLMALTVVLALKPWLQLAKARDAQRKADLKIMVGAIESYADDNVCYPEGSVVNVCQGGGLVPYLKSIPCDPLTKQSYYYVRLSDCKAFIIYAKLEIDTGIDYGIYNYAVTSGNVTAIPEI